MNVLKRSILLFLVAGLFLPEVALAFQHLKSEDPCGMIICCCKDMCRMAKQKAPSCHTKKTITCGTPSITAAPNAAPLNPLDSLGLMDVLASLLMPDERKWTAADLIYFYDSHIRPPSDKPPALSA